MKKIKWLFLVTLVAGGLIAFQSCQSTKTSTSSKMLKFNFEKGKGYDYEMNTSMDQEIQGQKMKMDMSAYYSMIVTDDDGTLKTITSTIDRFKMKMDMGGFNINVDTDQPLPSLGKTEDGKDPMKILNSVFGAIKGQQFQMKVNAEGKVLEVTGFEDMATKLVDSLGLDEEQKQQMKVQFNDQFNAKKMTGQFERAWYIFPNKEVKVGDSWNKTTTMGGEGTYASTYKVTEIEGDMVTLEENSTMTGMEDGAKMSGTITGTIVVDSRIGLVVSSNQDLKMKTNANGKAFEIIAKTKIKGKAR